MITIEKKIEAFRILGQFLKSFEKPNKNKDVEKLDKLIRESHLYNPWFIEKNVRYALVAIGKSLEEDNIRKWIEPYNESLEKQNIAKTVGVVMAGNLPLVGFSDFLCVLMSGNKILAKLSSDDNKLLPAIADKLIEIETGFKDYIKFTEEKLQNFDAIIATGSNNTSRYFEYYFGKYPHIIRKNRNGVAVLTGKESEEDFRKLGDDIFMYFGMGCRSVSKVFVPEGYLFNSFFEAIEDYKYVGEHHKYNNNYDYYKSIYLINTLKHLDNGFLLVKNDSSYSSPPSVLYFEEYKNIKNLNNRLIAESGQLQCTVSNSKEISGAVSFGMAQNPELWDYADGVDTLEFLLNF